MLIKKVLKLLKLLKSEYLTKETKDKITRIIGKKSLFFFNIYYKTNTKI